MGASTWLDTGGNEIVVELNLSGTCKPSSSIANSICVCAVVCGLLRVCVLHMGGAYRRNGQPLCGGTETPCESKSPPAECKYTCTMEMAYICGYYGTGKLYSADKSYP